MTNAVWQGLPGRERGLTLICAAYLVLLMAYLAVWPHAGSLKYVVVLLAVTLAALIPELAAERRLRLRLLLICIPAIGTAIVELADDRDTAKERAQLLAELSTAKTELSKQLRSLQLAKFRDQVRIQESRAREEMIQLDPRDAVKAIQKADKGFTAKAEWLSSQGAIEQGKAYRAAAEFVRREMRPRYTEFLARAERRSFPEMRAELDKITTFLEVRASQYRIAGFQNHIGVLAMGAGQPERALSHFYSGLVIDPDHLPLYESVGYAIWAVQENASGALKYAGSGLARVADLRNKTTASSPKDWIAHIDGMAERLRLQYAYFSALELRNEGPARAYVEELVASQPKDPEYLDALGFVLLRFAKNDTEMKRAAKLFRTAFETADANQEKLTRRLVERHQRELNDLRRELEGP